MDSGEEMSEAEEEGFRRMLEAFLRGDNPSWSPRSEEDQDCHCPHPWQDEVPLWDGEGASEAGAASNAPESPASPASPATPATPAMPQLIHVTPTNPEVPLDLTIQPLDLSMK